MNNLDHYLRTLRLFLPKKQREDIILELSEEIQAQIAEQEAALGRALRDDEEAMILKKYGHPLLAAARYRPHSHLIGPVIFPYYCLVLKVAIALVTIGHVIGALLLFAGGGPIESIGQVFLTLLGTVLKIVGWITALAATADVALARSRLLEKWSPSDSSSPLLHIANAIENALNAVPGAERKDVLAGDRLSKKVVPNASVSGFVLALVVSAWWLAGLKFPYLFFGPGAEELDWGVAMDRLFPVLVVAQLTVLAAHFFRLTRHGGILLARLTRIVWMIAGVAFIYFVGTSDHQWLVWRGAAEVRAHATIVAQIAGRDISLVDFVNYSLSIMFVMVAIASVARLVKTLLQRLSAQKSASAHA